MEDLRSLFNYNEAYNFFKAKLKTKWPDLTSHEVDDALSEIINSMSECTFEIPKRMPVVKNAYKARSFFEIDSDDTYTADEISEILAEECISNAEEAYN